MLKQRLEFRGDEVAAIDAGDVERFLASAIAGDEEGVSFAAPDREGEHAIEPVEERLAPLFEAVHEDFGVTVVGRELVTKRQQLVAQLAVVVDFAVEDDAVPLALVPHGLMAAIEVDD